MTKIQKTSVVLLIFILGGMQVTQAQLWKKAKERARKAAEETVLRKTEEKSAETTEQAMDSLFKADEKIKRKKQARKNENPLNEIVENSIYNFEWKYTLKLESKNTKDKDLDMLFNYYIDPNSTAFASEFNIEDVPVEMGRMIMILDPSIDLNVMLTEVGGNKIKKIMPIYNDDALTEEQPEHEFTVVKTDTKILLGYQCQGFKVTTQEAIMHMYITEDAPVSFSQSFTGNSNLKPKGFKTEWLKEFENGLMMEMQYTSTKNKKYNMKIRCIGLVEEPLTIDTNEYQFLGF